MHIHVLIFPSVCLQMWKRGYWSARPACLDHSSCCYVLHTNDCFCFYSALGQCDKAIEVYTSTPLTDFDGIVGIALAYFKKGLLQESIKGKHLPNSEHYGTLLLRLILTKFVCLTNLAVVQFISLSVPMHKYKFHNYFIH